MSEKEVKKETETVVIPVIESTTEKEETLKPEEEKTESSAPIEEEVSKTTTTVETEVKPKEETKVEEPSKVIPEKDLTDKIEESTSEEEEEEGNEPQKDFSILSEKELIDELQILIKEKPVQEIKTPVEEIKSAFNTKFNEELENSKEVFLAEGGNIIDFYYTTPLKKEFDSTYYSYKDKRSSFYKNLTKDLNENLTNRLGLIEELKGLFNEKEKTSTIFKHFKNIQERWFEAGAIPRDKYNTVWNNYHHHVENFYDILHLDREFRDRDFKHNLEQKLRLIGRAEELTKEENSNKAFRELQMLHKMWKEEIGPVAKEFRDDVWDKFSAATKIIHDKRQELLKELEKEYEANVTIKKELINEINLIAKNTKSNHQSWQNTIKKVQDLRDKFFESGKVPRTNNKEIWALFKEATRDFNKEKNIFYKSQKQEQYDNLEKKLGLIKVAEENKDSEDFDVVTQLMKKIQNDWKNIGHVPRKDSDKIWKQFKAVCNHYFARLHSQQDESDKEEFVHLDAKKEMLESLATLKLAGDPKKDIAIINEKITAWKNIGRVPYNKRTIEQKFNKKLDDLFGQLNLGKKETELIRFENKINSLNDQEDDRKLKNEEFFLSKKVGEVNDEIRQLENNLLFFKHVSDDNPMVKDVNKKVNKHKEELEVWKAKLIKIRNLRKQ